jgi:hypothetical protein
LGSQNRPSKAEAASARLTEERATQAAAPERRGFPLACSYRVSASAASSERFRTFVAAKPLRLTRTRSASSRASALTAFYPSSAVLFIRAGKENNVSDPRHGRVALVACAGQHEKKRERQQKSNVDRAARQVRPHAVTPTPFSPPRTNRCHQTQNKIPRFY